MSERDDFSPDDLDRMLDRVVAGDAAAHPAAAEIRAALGSGVPVAVESTHLAAIRAAVADISPERSPEPDWKLAVVPLDRVRARRARRTGRRVLVAAVAAVLMLTLGSSAALAAAQGANPGDPLYGVKRASERVALALRRSPESKAAFHLRLAERRLGEIETLAEAGRDVTGLADDFAEELDSAGKSDAADILARLRERTDAHIAHLTEILDRAPEAAQKGLQTAIERAERNGERAEQKRQEKAEQESDEPAPGDDDDGRPEDKGSPGNSGKAPGKGKSK